MKKRKPPIILVTCLILAVGVALAFNYATSASQDPKQQEQPEAPAVTGTQPDAKRAPADSAAKEAAAVKQQMASMTAPKPGGNPLEGRPILGPGQSSIDMPKMTRSYRPTPSDSQTAGQWYTKESAKSGQ